MHAKRTSDTVFLSPDTSPGVLILQEPLKHNTSSRFKTLKLRHRNVLKVGLFLYSSVI